jgi:hypothetical protein
MYANKPCATPFFYTPSTGLSFDSRGYLSGVSDWNQARGCNKAPLPLRTNGQLPVWPVKRAKIYPMVDHTNDYYPTMPDVDPNSVNVMTDSTQNWPRRAYRL